MSRSWNLNIHSNQISYSFWSFSSHGRGRQTHGISEATLGVFQNHPLHFKSNCDELIIEGAHNPSKRTIQWTNDRNVNAVIISKNNNMIIIKIEYNKNKYYFELQYMKENQKLYTISKTDLDLIIKNNFTIDITFDILTLICEYNEFIYDMNIHHGLLKYHNLEPNKGNNNNIVDTSNAPGSSYISLEMDNQLVNGDYDKFMVECDCKPCFDKSMHISGIVSLHGGGTGWELRVGNKYNFWRFEWVFTTYWMEDDRKKWMHNELLIDYPRAKDENEWIYLKGEYDYDNGLQTFTVNDQSISRKSKGKPQCETRRLVELGRGFGSGNRMYYGLIRNIKIDGWNLR